MSLSRLINRKLDEYINRLTAIEEAVRPIRSLDDYDDAATISRIVAELAALREDKARLDWMEAHNCCAVKLLPDRFGEPGQWEINDENQGTTIRAAIDAARTRKETHGDDESYRREIEDFKTPIFPPKIVPGKND